MIEFLKNNYFIVLYAVALMFSMFRYRYYFDSALKYFPIIIAYTLLSEVLGLLIRDVEEFQIIYVKGYSYYNQLIFNIFDVIFFLYFFYVYRKATNNPKVKKFIGIGAIVFVIVSTINPFVQDMMLFPQMYTIIAGSLIIIGCALNYLVQKRKLEDLRQKSNLLWFISIGLLVFYLFYPVIMAIGVLDYQLFEKLQLIEVLRMLIAIMYSCFIIGFARTKKRVVL